PKSILMADPPWATSCARAPTGQIRHRAVVINDSRAARLTSSRLGRPNTLALSLPVPGRVAEPAGRGRVGAARSFRRDLGWLSRFQPSAQDRLAGPTRSPLRVDHPPRD